MHSLLFVYVVFFFFFPVIFRSRGDLRIKKSFRKGAEGGKGNKKDEATKNLYSQIREKKKEKKKSMKYKMIKM